MDCEVSLPQKASWFCKFERSWELRKLKKIWKVKKSPSGFVLLDMPAWMLTAGSFVYPLTRSCISGYIETVFLSKSSELVYDVVDKLLPGNVSYHYYGILSTYFEKISLLGGVSIIIILETYLLHLINSVSAMIIIITRNSVH